MVSKIEYKQNGAFVSERVFDPPVKLGEAQRQKSEDEKYLKSSAPPYWSKVQKTVTAHMTTVDENPAV